MGSKCGNFLLSMRMTQVCQKSAHGQSQSKPILAIFGIWERFCRQLMYEAPLSGANNRKADRVNKKWLRNGAKKDSQNASNETGGVCEQRAKLAFLGLLLFCARTSTFSTAPGRLYPICSKGGKTKSPNSSFYTIIIFQIYQRHVNCVESGQICRKHITLTGCVRWVE